MRKLGLISSLWAALLLFPLAGFALGLGEIETSSFLNQPLKAKIQVISVRPGEIDDLLISLASRDAFKKAGLERPAGLSRLRFKVEKSEDGQTATILVSTKTAVKEPFLSFLVEADWAKGRLLREFTVLLDPMSFAQQAVQTAPPISPEQPELNESAVNKAEPVKKSQTVDRSSQQVVAQPIATPAESFASEQEVSFVSDSANTSTSEAQTTSASSEQVVVSRGDTLWGIASKFKDQDHSMAQVMLAMQMMDPDAFSKNNINNLKVGAVLRVPDMDVMDRLSKQEAYAQVLDQNGLWDEYVARKSGATTASTAMADSSSGIESSQQQQDSQLSLITADEGDSDSASLQNDANSQNAGQIRKQLALAEEELEAARLENNDLKSRLAILEQQQEKFEKLQKLVQIEDSGLARLQQAVAEEETVAEGAEEQVTDEKPSNVMIEAAGEILAEEKAFDQLETDPKPAAMDGMMEENITSTEAETVLETTAEVAEKMPVEEQVSQAETATVPAPIIVTQVPDSPVDGLMDMLPNVDQLLGDPIMLGGIGAVLALLIGLIFFRRKKAATDNDGITIEEPGDLIDDDATPFHVPSTTQLDAGDNNNLVETEVMEAEEDQLETLISEVDDDDEFSTTAVISAEELPNESDSAATQAEQDDVLNEVDVYLAYGLYDNAEDLLNDSLQNSPDRADYRAKLLDTYFATKNKDAFVKEAEVLKSLGGASDRFWDRIQFMGFGLAPENELFSGAKESNVSVEDLEYVKPESADFDIGAEDDVADLSNTDFDLSNDSFEISTTQVLDTGDDFSETQDLEAVDIEFPDLDEETVATAGLDDLSGDVVSDDNDFSSELRVENEKDVEFESDEDKDALNFDFPDDMDLSLEDDTATEIIELEPTVEVPPSFDQIPPMDDEDGVEIDFSETDDSQGDSAVDDTGSFSETLIMSADELEMEAEKVEEAAKEEADELNAEISLDEGLDFDMSDMEDASLQSGEFSPSDTVALAELDLGEETQKEDDITEFRPADSTGELDAFIAEATDEEAINEVDAEAGLEKTGTFAPGDFNEEEMTDLVTGLDGIDDIGNIGDLMLPDDVDEVGTKLDLARAFIDMGDAEGARSSLEEVLAEGTDEQKAEATGLLGQIK